MRSSKDTMEAPARVRSFTTLETKLDENGNQITDLRKLFILGFLVVMVMIMTIFALTIASFYITDTPSNNGIIKSHVQFHCGRFSLPLQNISKEINVLCKNSADCDVLLNIGRTLTTLGGKPLLQGSELTVNDFSEDPTTLTVPSLKTQDVFVARLPDTTVEMTVTGRQAFTEVYRENNLR